MRRSHALALLAVAVVGLTGPASGGVFPTRLVGGGVISGIEDPDIKTTFSVNLRCAGIEDPNIRGGSDLLDIRSGDDHFLLELMATTACEGGIEDPNIHTGFHEGVGSGRCNGEPADVSWRFVASAGRAGDSASFAVTGGCTIAVPASILPAGSLQFIEDPNI